MAAASRRFGVLASIFAIADVVVCFGLKHGAIAAGEAPMREKQLTSEVEVPEGLAEGDVFRVRTADGQTVALKVPANTLPGSMMTFVYTPREHVRPVQKAQLTGQAVVPKGLKAGDKFQVRTADGQTVAMTVPLGVEPGSTMTFTYSPLKTPPPPPPAAQQGTRLTGRVVVPNGLREGDKFRVSVAGGQRVTLVVPANAEAGSKMSFTYTPRTLANADSSGPPQVLQHGAKGALRLDAAEDPRVQELNELRETARQGTNMIAKLERQIDTAGLAGEGAGARAHVPPPATFVEPPEEIYTDTQGVAEEDADGQQGAGAPAAPETRIAEFQRKGVAGSFVKESTQLQGEVARRLETARKQAHETSDGRSMTFAAGEKIKLWSNVQAGWLDATVKEVFPGKGVNVESSEGQKFLMPEQFKRMLQKESSDSDAGGLVAGGDKWRLVSNLYHKDANALELAKMAGMSNATSAGESPQQAGSGFNLVETVKPLRPAAGSGNFLKDIKTMFEEKKRAQKEDASAEDPYLSTMEHLFSKVLGVSKPGAPAERGQAPPGVEFVQTDATQVSSLSQLASGQQALRAQSGAGAWRQKIIDAYKPGHHHEEPEPEDTASIKEIAKAFNPEFAQEMAQNKKDRDIRRAMKLFEGPAARAERVRQKLKAEDPTLRKENEAQFLAMLKLQPNFVVSKIKPESSKKEGEDEEDDDDDDEEEEAPDRHTLFVKSQEGRIAQLLNAAKYSKTVPRTKENVEPLALSLTKANELYQAKSNGTAAGQHKAKAKREWSNLEAKHVKDIKHGMRGYVNPKMIEEQAERKRQRKAGLKRRAHETPAERAKRRKWRQHMMRVAEFKTFK